MIRIIGVVVLCCGCSLLAAQPEASVSSVEPSGVLIRADMTEAELIASAAPAITFMSVTIYAGFQQVSANNQDPLIVAFRDGRRFWVRDDYDQTPVDGRATGLLWDGTDRLYAAFRTDGSDADPGLRAFTTGGWLRSYGPGGGRPVTVILRLDPFTGNPTGEGTFIVSQLSNGLTNSAIATGLSFCGEDDVIVFLDSSFAPLRPDRTRMSAPGVASSPFEYRVRLTADLSTALEAEAIGLDGVEAFTFPPSACLPPGPTVPGPCSVADLAPTDGRFGTLDGNDIAAFVRAFLDGCR